MLKVLSLISSLIFTIIFIETFVSFLYPRLKKNQFKFREILKKSEYLDWDQTKNFSFLYFNRYLNKSKKIQLKTNNFLVIDS